MGIAVELLFDEETEKAVRKAWAWLADARDLPFMHKSGVVPHISLAVFEGGEVEAEAEWLRDFAGTVRPFPVTLSGVDVFEETHVLFAAPAESDALRSLHARFWRMLPDFGENPWPHYFCENWRPHCTLAIDVPDVSPAWLAPVQTHMENVLTLPRASMVTGIALVEFRPVKALCSYPLVGQE